MKKKLSLFLFLSSIPIYSTIETTLAQAATAKTFSRATGTLYLGLDGGNDKAVSKIERYNGENEIQLTGIATNSLLNDASIEFLTLSESEGDTNPYLVIVKKSNLGNFKQTKIILATNDGTTVHELETDLNDASGTAITDGIVQIAASNDYIFAAVKGNGETVFGKNDSGIAVIKIDKINNKLVIQDATTGSDGNRALTLNESTTELRINTDVIFGFNHPNIVTMAWSEELQKLYIGYDIRTGPGGSDGGLALLVANIDTTDSNKLKYLPAAPLNLFNTNRRRIIGIRRANINIGIQHLDIMRTTVGSDYLIVHGDVGWPAGTAPLLNSIFAIPLINNPTNATTHGTTAQRNGALNNEFKFITPSTTAGHLTSNNQNPAKVGGNPLPLQIAQSISDMMVIGDTVYISIAEQQSNINDSGIFYSQALFDQTGRINRWTRWKKRAFPFNSFSSKNITDPFDQPRVQFLSVDALNGKIFAVDGNTNTTVASLQWSNGEQNTKSLTYNVNQALSSGCFSSLDINQDTRGISISCPGRYHLFGGVGTVVFAKASISKEPGGNFTIQASNRPAAQTIPTDYSSPENFFISTLPEEAGAVTSLEYSRRLIASTNQNYFFAGTQNGLYAFADSAGGGFTLTSATNNLNAAPFSTRSWQKVNGIDGQVLAIKTSGAGATGADNGALYILTLELTQDPESPFKNNVYRMRYNTTIALMEGNIAKIAETKTFAAGSDLSDVLSFFDIEIISTNGAGTSEQLILSTNEGLFKSNTTGSGILTNANNQADALWQKIDETDSELYFKIFGIDNLTKTMFWPTKLTSSLALNSQTQQFYGNQFTGGQTQTRLTQNLSNFINEEQNFSTLKFTKKFWTDGGRRLFIAETVENGKTKNVITAIPFNSTVWNVANTTSTIINDSILKEGNILFNWIKQIGASGILMAGTNKGVISLE